MNKVAIQPGVRSMLDHDGAVLLDLDSGKYFSLSDVAAQIWGKFEEGLQPSEIVSWMENQFGASVPRERLQDDLEALVKGLEAKGLVRAIS